MGRHHRRRRRQPANSLLPLPAMLQVEDPKRALLVYGNKTSQVVKDVMTDLHKLKGVRFSCCSSVMLGAAAFQPVAAWFCPASSVHATVADGI